MANYNVIEANQERWPGCWRPVASEEFITRGGIPVFEGSIGGVCGKDVKLNPSDNSWVDNPSYVYGNVEIIDSDITDSCIVADCTIKSSDIKNSSISITRKKDCKVDLSITGSVLTRFTNIISSYCTGKIIIDKSEMQDVQLNYADTKPLYAEFTASYVNGVTFDLPAENIKYDGKTYIINCDNNPLRDGKDIYPVGNRPNQHDRMFNFPVDFTIPPLDLSDAFVFINSRYKWEKLESFMVYLSSDNKHVIANLNSFVFELRTTMYGNLILDDIFGTKITYGWGSLPNEAKLQLKTLLTYAYSYFAQFIKQ